MALRLSPAQIPFLCLRIISANLSAALLPMPVMVDVYAQALINAKL
jgi:hypothetical protein